MTRLVFLKHGEHFCGFRCIGHSGYANAGDDIVCAAVSTAVQMTADYLQTYFTDMVELTVDAESAEIQLRCASTFTEADRQISVLENFARSVGEQYPNYFNFEFTEV